MLVAVVSLCCLAGCNFGGPSEDEVAQALDAAMRAFADSVEEKTPEIEASYSNAVDLVFRNDDESLVHQMNVLVDDEDVTVYGDCKISEYEDYDSVYLISGKLVYEMLFPGGRTDIGFGVMDTHRFCECPRCTREVGRNREIAGESQTDLRRVEMAAGRLTHGPLYWRFMNRLAGRLAKALITELRDEIHEEGERQHETQPQA